MNFESYAEGINALRNISCKKKTEKKKNLKKTTRKKYRDENDKCKQSTVRKFK